jgi:short-subunit dehydrogenase
MLVNNAGIGDCSYFETTDLEFYLNMMNINAQTVVSLTRIFFPKLRMHKKAYILNTGSFAALMPLPFKSVYSATKSFVLAFSRSLNMELKEFGIHVSCVCPGPTKTENIRLRYQLDGQSSNFFIMEPEVVAKLAIDGLFNHKELIVPGWKNRLLLTCGSFVPLAIKHYILKSIFRKEVKNNGAIQNEVIGSEIKQSFSVQNGVIPKATMQSGEIINGKNHISDSFLIKGSGFSNPLQKLN